MLVKLSQFDLFCTVYSLLYFLFFSLFLFSVFLQNHDEVFIVKLHSLLYHLISAWFGMAYVLH